MELIDKIERLLPSDIEKRSFEIIGEELNKMGISLPAENESVIKRAIHTSADFDYAHGHQYGSYRHQQKDALKIRRNRALFYGR